MRVSFVRAAGIGQCNAAAGVEADHVLSGAVAQVNSLASPITIDDVFPLHFSWVLSSPDRAVVATGYATFAPIFRP